MSDVRHFPYVDLTSSTYWAYRYSKLSRKLLYQYLRRMEINLSLISHTLTYPHIFGKSHFVFPTQKEGTNNWQALLRALASWLKFYFSLIYLKLMLKLKSSQNTLNIYLPISFLRQLLDFDSLKNVENIQNLM